MACQRCIRQRPNNECSLTWTAFDQSIVLQFPIRLEHCIWVDCQPGHNHAHRWKLVALLEETEPQRLLDLLNKLQVRGNSRAVIEIELNRLFFALHRDRKSTRLNSSHVEIS